MSLIDLASMVLAPTAVKEGKVYSAIPDTGDGDMTFTRGSSATRVNSAGLIEKERGNLLLQSNDFDTTWIKSNATVTAGQTGYDGSSDAWLQQSTSTFCRLDQNITQTGILTLSAYAKAGTSNFLLLEVTRSGGVFYAWFDLSSGVVGTTSAIDANIESVGNGWYRCSLIGNQTLSGQARLRIADSNGSTVTTTSSNIYIQDAMLNEGLVAQPYIETTTTAVYEGITDDVPRVDYSGGGCPSLLLEPSRTNGFPQSEYPSTSTLNLVNGGYTWTHNQTNSPEGIQNASKWAAANNNAVVGVYQNFSATSGASYTFSVFAKKGDHNFIQLQNGGGGSGANSYANFDLENGTKSDGATITDSFINDFGNGWYRIGITFTTSLTSTSNCSIDIIDSLSAGRNSTFTGSVGDYFYIWGMQVEQASYVSSYIPTYGTSTSRVADSCSKTGISELIGQTEGTLFLDVDTTNFEGDQRFGISDGTSVNRIVLRLSGSIIQFSVVSASTIQASISGSGSSGNRYKMAGVYKENDFALYVNGSLIGTDTSGTISGTFSRIANDNGVGGQNFYNPIKQAILFPTRLTNDQLEELTK